MVAYFTYDEFPSNIILNEVVQISKNKMQIVKILGGLGNQMFQYAFYCALKERFPMEDCLLDISLFKGYPLHHGFELKRIFGIDEPIATTKQVAMLSYPYTHYRIWQIGKHVLPKRKTTIMENADMTLLKEFPSCSIYYDGYWQHEEYFSSIAKTIKQIYTFPNITDYNNLSAIDNIRQIETTSIHVRLGDYTNNPLYQNICDLPFYRKAIQYILEKTQTKQFYIFSNDTAWCKIHLSHLLSGTNVVYVDWNKGADSYRDMQLMSLCHHHIIANSSFSWWGAWINEQANTIVVAPKFWINLPNYFSPACKRWITI